MKLRLTIFIIAIFFAFNFNAQNLGYLGRKRSLGVGGDTWPSFYYAIQGTDGLHNTIDGVKDFSSFHMVFRPTLYYRKTIGKGAEIGLDLQHFTFYQSVNTNYTLETSQPTYNFNNSGSTVTETSGKIIYTYYGNYGLYKYTAFKGATNAIGFYINDYFKGDIAPIGTYMTYKFKIYQTRLAGYGKEIELGYKSGYTSSISSIPNKSYYTYQLGMGIHKKSIISKNYFLDFGFDVSMGYNPLSLGRRYDNVLNGIQYYMGRYVLGTSHAMISIIIGKIL